jgi:hypothetical protein
LIIDRRQLGLEHGLLGGKHTAVGVARRINSLARLPRFESLLDSFPDPRTLSDDQLADLIDELTREDHDTELTRRSGSADDDLG